MAPGIERDDLPGLAPIAGTGRSRPTGEVLVRSGRAIGLERAGRNRQRAIERIGAAMRADRVAVDARIDGADHRAALARRGRAPVDREARRTPPAPDAR